MRGSLHGALAACLVFSVARWSCAAGGGPVEKVEFNRDVRPILAKNCFACHGADDKHREGGLRLDVRDAAIKKLADGTTALVPGRPDASELIRRIASGDKDERMPPADSNPPLSRPQIELLTRWIAEGATYRMHWSFEKPVRPPLPLLTKVEGTAPKKGEAPAQRAMEWPANPIDPFILSKLDTAGLGTSPPADRYALVRRLSLDLRGLPPAPAEVEEFLHDGDPVAYSRLVDRMLADPAFGERWARPWLDLARYADSAGYASDPLRIIWPYRDWVIDALNTDMPFDQFTIEQLAGDLLPNPTSEQLVATAFHRNTMTNTEGGTDDEEFRVAAVKDRVDTTFDVWMGLTIGCAKCHTHKYDPITQAEYYRCFAIFNQTADADRGDEAPTLSLGNPDVTRRSAEIDRQIADLRKGLAKSKEKRRIERQIARLARSKPSPATVPVMQELASAQHRPTHLMLKGNFLVLGDAVEPGVPAFFGSLPAAQPDRLALARWLVGRDNPLTARVAVNRLWSQLFGQGIVETEEDFGTQGKPPSHPELLDWLAVEYQHRQWDTKSLLRLLVTSATYRQSARITPAAPQINPGNHLLGRSSRFRLEAETVRDQALALSGLLSRKMKGPSVFPPQPDGLWRAAFNGRDRSWMTSAGADRYRRGMYTFWRRTIPYPSMATFDAPSREICSVRRVRTNTPLQAFVTLNDPAFVEAAQALARRIVREGGSTPAERCRYGISLCLARPATDAQVDELVSLLLSERKHYQADPKAADRLATVPLGRMSDGLPESELAAWTVVANVLLNLDAVLTKS